MSSTRQLDLALAEPLVRYKWSFDPAPHFPPSAPSPIETTKSRTRLLAILGDWRIANADDAPSMPHVMRAQRDDAHAARLLVEALGFTAVSARAKCRIESTRPDGSCGVIFGARAEDDYYVARIEGGELRLVRVIGAVETELGHTPIVIDRGAYHDVMVWARGGDAFVSLDGALAFSSKIEPLGLTRVGLFARGDATFDDLSAIQLDRPER